MFLEATSHQYLVIGNWASYPFCSPLWPCCSDLHCELPHTACTSVQEQGHENATLSGPCLSSFPSLCHWSYRESAHKSQSPQGLDSSWTRDCPSCSDLIPWGYSRRLGLKQREKLYWKQKKNQRHFGPQEKIWAMLGTCSSYCSVRSCLYFTSLKFRGTWSKNVVQIRIKQITGSYYVCVHVHVHVPATYTLMNI